MTFVTASERHARTHAFLDEAGHGVYAYADDTSFYLSELPYRLISVLAFYPFDTIIPYQKIAIAMWPDEVPDPYDGSFNGMIQDHLDDIRSVMQQQGGWSRKTFRTVYSQGIRVNSHHLPEPHR